MVAGVDFGTGTGGCFVVDLVAADLGAGMAVVG